MRLTKKQWKLLSDKNSFSTYSQWEEYVRNKCKNNQIILEDFSRYLEQRSRAIEPTSKMNSMVYPCLISLTTSGMFGYVTDVISGEKGSWLTVFFFLLGLISVIGLLAWVVYHVCDQLNNNSLNEAFFRDYKSIIDEMIREQVSEENNTKQFDLIKKKKGTKVIQISISGDKDTKKVLKKMKKILK